jgi:hypothetical protein
MGFVDDFTRSNHHGATSIVAVTVPTFLSKGRTDEASTIACTESLTILLEILLIVSTPPHIEGILLHCPSRDSTYPSNSSHDFTL